MKNKCNLIGKSFKDSIIVDYTDNSIILKDRNGSLIEVKDARFLMNFYKEQIKSYDENNVEDRKDLKQLLKEIKEDNELELSDAKLLVSLINAKLNNSKLSFVKKTAY